MHAQRTFVKASSQLAFAHTGPGIRQVGFTLVELVLVISLLAILSLAVWPRLSSPNAFAQQTASQNLVSHLNYARGRSLSTGCAQALYLDVAGYSLWQDSQCGQSSALQCFDLPLSLQGQPLTGKQPSHTEPLRLVWDSKGQAHSIASSGCVDPADHQLLANGHLLSLQPRSLIIDGGTGYVRLL